ncbi:RCC1 domain-containing protein [Reinekea sp.]|jgi:alpha-tubulin suppressor-like RCC1 family protein|uniref:RCC1 domain-containing protein n=1 Tax=Reinekea sp. TaxID=1970455 RepID=UPI00398A23E2
MSASEISGVVSIDGVSAVRPVLVISDDPTGRQILAEGMSNPDGSFLIQYTGWEGSVIALALDHYGADWTAEKTLNAGTIIHPTAANGFVYEASTGGTTGITEPAWAIDGTSATTDGSVSWVPKPYYRPIASGPIKGNVTQLEPAPIVFRETITAGGDFTIAINSNGAIEGWGADTGGILSGIPIVTNAIEVVAGHDHALALLSDGSVVGWGNNTAGKATPPNNLGLCQKIAAGPTGSAAIQKDGNLVVWGDSTKGQANIPAEVINPIDIAFTYRTITALLSNGTLVAWGDNYSTLVTGKPNISNGIQVVGGRYAFAVLTDSGQVFEWGQKQSAPSAADPNIKFIAGGGYSFGAPRNDSTIISWGQTAGPAQSLNMVRLAYGSYNSAHGAAILNDKSVFCWGDNDNGQSTPPVGFQALIPKNPDRFIK